MELFCPECMGSLETIDGEMARCTTHGGEYHILFCREIYAAEIDTAADAVTDAESGPTVVPDGISNKPSPLAGLNISCANHPSNNAVRRCVSCGTPICETCAFTFPGNVVVCPSCAVSPKTTLSPKRRSYLILSFICASIATLFMVALFGGAFEGMLQDESDLQVLGVIMMLVLLGSTVPGIALAVSARLPGRPSSIGIWIAMIWNSVLLAGFLLLCLIGNMQ